MDDLRYFLWALTGHELLTPAEQITRSARNLVRFGHPGLTGEEEDSFVAAILFADHVGSAVGLPRHPGLEGTPSGRHVLEAARKLLPPGCNGGFYPGGDPGAPRLYFRLSAGSDVSDLLAPWWRNTICMMCLLGIGSTKLERFGVPVYSGTSREWANLARHIWERELRPELSL